MTDVQDNAAAPGQAPQISILAQFVKDLSFENPGVAAQLPQSKPQIQVQMDVQVRPLGAEQFEVALRAMIEAKAGEARAYVVELVYAGVFLLKNLPAEAQQPFLLIECPRILFPFARRIIADVTRDGGYQPLMLDPIDFASLYRAQLERQRAAQASGTAGTA
ncbi:MAG: protein-export chaperone SecB [Alphaproteobacteria bacterium]|nr:protein-export chaperone SecB [Alphaproteobacteria bacterium]